ncbi:MAG: RNA-binding protein [Chloroflexota bacterium]|nr:RNA-binding protein [Chloroflexota bacterium]MYB16189.1 RNA-binding protein [Chloroflexota bacterium]MYE67990.1 RNA-binding protein [Acidimicrobiia bacterium]
MPVGPRGEKRPADVIGCAVMVAKIATGELEEELSAESQDTEAKSEAGKKGGKARAGALTPERRTEIAQAGAKARWNKETGDVAA